MTSVPFDLNLQFRDKNGKPFKFDTVEFRFGTLEARQLEIAAGSGIQWLVARGQSVTALVHLVHYGLKQQFPKMTEALACDIIDAFVQAGGDTGKLSTAAYKALNESGVYGKAEELAEEAEASGDPLATTPTTVQ